MKKTLAKIFGVAVVIALLVSMIVAAVPTSALTYGATAVALSSSTISANSSYTVTFAVSLNLVDGNKIVVTFPYDTTIPGGAIAGVTIANNGSAGQPAAATGNAASRQVTVTVPATSAPYVVPTVGTINTLVFPLGAGLYNPSSPGSYSISIATTDSAGNGIEAAVSSPAYTIGLLTAVNVYNQAGNLVASPGNLQDALNIVQNNYTVKLGAATYSTNTGTSGAGLFVLGGTLDPTGTIITPAVTPPTNVTITSADGNAADTVIGKTYPSTVATSLTIYGSYVTVTNLTFNGQVFNNATNATFTGCVFNQRGGSSFTPLFTNNNATTTAWSPAVPPLTLVQAATGNLLTLSNNTFDTTANGGNTGGFTVAAQINDVVALGTLTNDSIMSNTFKIGQNASLVPDVAIQTGPSVLTVAYPTPLIPPMLSW